MVLLNALGLLYSAEQILQEIITVLLRVAYSTPTRITCLAGEAVALRRSRICLALGSSCATHPED